MKTKQYPHGMAFEQSYRLVLKGEVSGNPLGWGTAEHERKFLEEELHPLIRDLVARYYQCKLAGTSLKVEVDA